MSPTIVRMKIASSQISTVWLSLAPDRDSRMVVRVEETPGVVLHARAYSSSHSNSQQCVSDDLGDVEQNDDLVSDSNHSACQPLIAPRFVRRADIRPQNSLDISQFIYNQANDFRHAIDQNDRTAPRRDGWTVQADTEVENRYDRSAQVDQPGDEGRRSGQRRGPAIGDDLADAAQLTGTGSAGRREDEEPGGVGGVP
jgi:hypothetical protein